MQFEALEARRLLSVNLLSDAAGLSATNSITINGTSYFFANNGNAGRELWKSDGTIAGTVQVKDLTPGAGSSELVSIFQANGKAVFLTVVHHGVLNKQLDDDYTLWASDGTDAGTVKLMQFNSVVDLKAIQVGDQVAIALGKQSPLADTNNVADDAYLYFTDGTSAGTRLVKTHLAQDLGNDQITTHVALKLFTAGNHVVYTTQEDDLWSSDGVTTTDLRSLLGTGNASTYKVALDKIVQLDGKVLIPSQNGLDKFWVSDGTSAGTVVHTVDVTGSLEPVGDTDTVVGDKYLFTEVEPGTIVKRVKAFDLSDDSITTLYTTVGDGSSQHITMYKLSGRILFNVVDLEALTDQLYSTDGTVAGTVKLADFNNFAQVYAPSMIGDTGYFVVARANYIVDNEPIGWIGSGTAFTDANAPGNASLELWRTDGTAANTGKVKDIWVGNPAGLVVSSDLAVADGKLLVHLNIKTGTISNAYPTNPGTVLTLVSDDTSAYDPVELTFGRQGASARLVNGVLKINGSTGDDHVRVWRSQRMPDKLIVEYNGNERSFDFASITKIVADLQDGNDYFQILEGEGQTIHTKTSIMGGDGSDTIFGGSGHDTILGGNSGDLIYGRGNADVIDGGGGKDRINGGSGNDQIAGGSGVDKIVGGAGVNVFFGQTAVEMAFGENVEGNDLVNDVFLG